MTIPELLGKVDVDGNIVNADGTYNCIKIAIDYVWNLPKFSARIGQSEADVRTALFKYTHQEALKDPSRRAYLPPVGGITVYIFGDPRKLQDPSTEVAVRVHDSCCGSDVFGTDICTCRPYLVFAIKAAVETAVRGGVGVIIYFQKEGRSLGEVTKFRVYNARKNQSGGDRPENYFYQTESIAGIRDARFQEMMPDTLLWLGITRIDWLLSMSSDKYDAIANMGIKVMQRVSLPDKFVPANAQTEIAAKISAGYHTEAAGTDADEVIQKLRGLEMVRERCEEVLALVVQGKGHHFDLHLDKLPHAVDLVVESIRTNYPNLDIPYHSRWRHFSPGSVDELRRLWRCDKVEVARRLIDLAMISVLLDAGAGPDWKYVDPSGKEFRRSEGLAVATFIMFKDGLFSSDRAMPHRVNSLGLLNLSYEDFSHGLQVSSSNPMAGLKGRFKLLQRLAEALNSHPEFFGEEIPRPGHLVDYALRNAEKNHVSLKVFWRAIILGLESIWPNTLSGIRRGDIWVYNPLKKLGMVGSDMVPFHKLSQWLTMSMLEPLEELGLTIDDEHLFTALAEYRNGGLLIDSGVLTLKAAEHYRTFFDVGSELVVEWRALTVCLIDRLVIGVREKLNKTVQELPMTRILQGGTWAAGRVIASQLRPGGTPPISIRSDGSVF